MSQDNASERVNWTRLHQLADLQLVAEQAGDEDESYRLAELATQEFGELAWTAAYDYARL